MKFELQVVNGFAIHQRKRVKVCLLMTSDAIGTYQLQNLNLLTFVFGVHDCIVAEHWRKTTSLAQCLELVFDSGMRNIRAGIIISRSQGLKEFLPLAWDRFSVG